MPMGTGTCTGRPQRVPGFAYAADTTMGIMNDAGNAMTHCVNGVSGMTLESGTGSSTGRMVLTIWAT